MTRQQLFAAFFFAVLLFLLYQFYLILAVFLTPLTWAGLLALIFYPVQGWLTGRLRGRAALAAFVLTTAVIVVVILPTILLGAVLVGESVAAYQHIQELIESGTLAQWIESLRSTILGVLANYLPGQLQEQRIDLPSLLLRASDSISKFLVAQATGALKNVLLFVANFFLTTFALFFFLRDGERMVAYVRAAIPMEPGHKDTVLARFSDTLTAVVQGSLVTAAAQGLLAGVGYWMVGVPFAVLLGFATAFLSLLPAGAALVWVSVVLYLGAMQAWVRMLVMLVWGTLVISGVDNLIRPWIIGGRTQIPTVFLFFGILGGLQVYGFLGMFLAPVVIAILVAFVRIYREQYDTAA